MSTTLYTVLRQNSIFSGRLLSCSSDRLRKSFVPRAIQLFNATQKGGLLYMSLPQSALPCSSHLSPMHKLYHLHILHSHFALCTFQTHPPTITRSLSCTPHPHKHKNIIFFFCTIHTSSTRSLFTFHFPPGHDTVKIIAIGSDPFLYLETLYVNMFSLCVCICDLCMYVGEVY